MRYSFGNEGYGEQYDAAGGGKCWEMWHPALPDSPYCGRELDHDGNHRGFNLSWPEEPQVDEETAQRFLTAYRRIPNGTTGIVLNDDGSVSMTLDALEAAVRFTHVRDDDDY